MNLPPSLLTYIFCNSPLSYSCPAGWIPNEEGGCTDDNECASDPCNNGGTCINLDNGQGFLCVCASGYTGDICHLPVQEKMILVAKGAYWVIGFVLINMIVLFMALFFMMRKGKIEQKYGDPDDDVRENIISYDDEGGGEDDMHAFDITPLRIPINQSGTMISARSKQPGQLIDPGVLLIEGDERDAGPRALDSVLDDLRNYAYEGCGSTAGSLSSLASIGKGEDEAQDFEYLSRWGPKFQNLANLSSFNE